jgi:beta-phosphoglucomutase family hydrolase
VNATGPPRPGGSLRAMLGLPDGIRGYLFDMDGVLTETAKVHAAAWKKTFDEVLKEVSSRDGTSFVPFDVVKDYGPYVDGKPRYEGVQSFLESRGIHLPQGTPDDKPGHDTICAVGNEKNEQVQQLIRTDGVDAFPGSVRYLDALRDAGLPAAVVSSSANTVEVLKAAGLTDYFQGVVDANTLEQQHLRGKPHPDTFLAAAKMLDIPPAEAVVFEDALAGVAAGAAGHFGAVVGVNRLDQAAALKEHGATIVVDDLGDLL